MISVFISVFLPKEKHGDLTGDIKILKKSQENTQNIHSKQQENMKKKKSSNENNCEKSIYLFCFPPPEFREAIGFNTPRVKDSEKEKDSAKLIF